MNLKASLVAPLAICLLAQTPAATAQHSPSFVLTTTSGAKISNTSLKGKVVVFDFWATWCGPCKRASPVMQKLSQEFKSKLAVIAVDYKETNPGPKPSKQYASQHGYTYTFTYGSESLASSLGIPSVPAFVVLDKTGKVREKIVGLPQGGPDSLYSGLKKRISALLKG